MNNHSKRLRLTCALIVPLIVSCGSEEPKEPASSPDAVFDLTDEEVEIRAQAYSEEITEAANEYVDARDGLTSLQRFATDMPFHGIDPADAEPFIGEDWESELLPLLDLEVFEAQRPNIIAVIGLVGGDDAVPVLMEMAGADKYQRQLSYIISAIGSAAAQSKNVTAERFLLARLDKKQLHSLMPNAEPSQIESVHYNAGKALAKIASDTAIRALEADAATDEHSAGHLQWANSIRAAGGYKAYVKNGSQIQSRSQIQDEEKIMAPTKESGALIR